jgi:hypothetical protein
MTRVRKLRSLETAAAGLDGLRCGLRFIISQASGDKRGPDGFQFFVVSIEHRSPFRDPPVERSACALGVRTARR